MGNQLGKPTENLIAKNKFSDVEFRTLENAFSCMVNQSNCGGKYVTEPVFKSFHGINNILGTLIFNNLADIQDDKYLSFESYLLFRAEYEKSSPEDTENCIFQIISKSKDYILRKDLEEIVKSVIGSLSGVAETIEPSFPESLLATASFSDQGLSFQNFRKWLISVPSMKKYLLSLTTEVSSGRAAPLLIFPPEAQNHLILRPEYGWFLLGMLSDKDKFWSLAFNSSMDGQSFNSFMGKARNVSQPTVLIVRDKLGFIFGGYASQAWEKHSEFYGDLKSFLFSLHPKAAIYKPTGANSNLQWCGINFTSESIPNGIGFGGQIGHYGLFLESNFEGGHSRGSVTFNNAVLSSDPNFEIDVVEIWVVSSTGNFQDNNSTALKGTILERFKEDRAVLNLVGIAGASENTRSE